jgi:hypothetical protein
MRMHLRKKDRPSYRRERYSKKMKRRRTPSRNTIGIRDCSEAKN